MTYQGTGTYTGLSGTKYNGKVYDQTPSGDNWDPGADHSPAIVRMVETGSLAWGKDLISGKIYSSRTPGGEHGTIEGWIVEFYFIMDPGQIVVSGGEEGMVKWAQPGPVYNLRLMAPTEVIDTDKIDLAWDISSAALEYHVYRANVKKEESSELEVIGTYSKVGTVKETRSYDKMTPDDIKYNPVMWADFNAFNGRFAYAVKSWTEYAGGAEGPSSNIVKVTNERKESKLKIPLWGWAILALAILAFIVIMLHRGGYL